VAPPTVKATIDGHPAAPVELPDGRDPAKLRVGDILTVRRPWATNWFSVKVTGFEKRDGQTQYKMETIR
jgi:hypothetical protein